MIFMLYNYIIILFFTRVCTMSRESLERAILSSGQGCFETPRKRNFSRYPHLAKVRRD